MAVTSVKIANTELLVAGSMTVARETLYALTAATPAEPRLVAMAGRHPAYVNETPKERSIPLIVHFRNQSEETRRAAWLTLAALLTSAAGLVELKWTDTGTTKRYWCAVTDAHPDAMFSVATAALVAPDPVAESA